MGAFIFPTIKEFDMNKKFWTGFVVVFVLMEIMMFLIHGMILSSAYQATQALWRPDMMSLMWIYHVLAIIGAFFFTLVFSKGYEGKGVMEGVRYGLYIGIWMSAGMAYGSYAMINIPYSLALQWFLYGMIEYIVYGVALAMVYGKQATVTPAAKA
ncbi:MAG TPA: hypothetical protein DGH68_03410 [Bacteroidetes bacterium]|nr:hypothetical protein [Bacteroidota bacterium]